MRDKYIELIREYIKIKPDYKSNLNEIKENVLLVGATEEEFNEALRQTEAQNTPKKLKPNYKKVFLDVSESIGNNAITFANSAKNNLIDKKKYTAGFAILVIFILFLTQTQKINLLKKEVPKPTLPKIALNARNPVPVVYANTTAIDPDKIFSIKGKNTIALTISGKPKKEIMGFFPYWMLPTQDKVDLSTLTSMSLFGLEVDNQGNISTKGTDGSDDPGWTMWNDPRLDVLLKNARNNNLKVYLTLKSFNSDTIEKLATSDEAQKNLIANALYLVNSKNLDGINIDFEYLGTPSDTVRSGFTRLITNLNAELKRQLPTSVLTVDTYLVSGSENGLFNISLLAPNLDAFVIMGYDMHTPLGDPGPVSAMGGDTNIIGYVQNYLEKVDASKLILAVPYYGYDWPVDTNSPDAVKILPYAEIAQESQNLQLSWDETSETPYFNYTDDNGTKRVVHFDNVRSLGIKYDFINQKNLRGVGIWALGYDGQNQDLEKLLIDKFIND